MIIQFQTGKVTFFEEDKEYFEKRLKDVLKFLGKESGDNDSIHLKITIEKNKHHSGERFEAKAHMKSPHKGDFFAETHAINIRTIADNLKKELIKQVKKFHESKQKK